MSLAIKIYEAFKDDELKAKALSEVVDELERRIVPMEQISTKGDLEITRLTLEKDIEEVRLTLKKDIEEVRLTLKKDIEEFRLTLEKNIEEVRLTLEKNIEEAKSGIIKWVIGLLLVQIGIITTIITLLR
jgi:hypothetical protein